MTRWTEETEELAARALEDVRPPESDPLRPDEAFFDDARRVLTALADAGLLGDAERLKAAELVCTLYGWTAPRYDSDRDKAALQAWMDWSHAYGAAANSIPASSPYWDEVITRLARKRDEIRNATLARIRGEAS